VLPVIFGNTKLGTILTTCYPAGLRISEAVYLKTPDNSSKQVVIGVEEGKKNPRRCSLRRS
jgi:site-specific recombinase XerD